MFVVWFVIACWFVVVVGWVCAICSLDDVAVMIVVGVFVDVCGW